MTHHLPRRALHQGAASLAAALADTRSTSRRT